jgi:hypothetical protein
MGWTPKNAILEEQKHAVAEVSNVGIHQFSDKSILMTEWE